MPDTDETEDTAPSNAELADRVTALDTKLDRIIDMFGSKEGQAHAAAQQHTEDRLDRPSSIAEEIRAQLEQQRAADAKAAADKSSADRLAAVEERMAGMAEQAPEPPQRRIERILGWR